MGSERSVYVSKETETMNSFEAHKDAVREQAGQCGPAHTRVELISDAPGERKPEEKEIDAAARPDPVEPPIVAAAPGSAGLVEPVTSFDEAFGEASSGIATDDTNAPAEPGGRSAASGTDDVAIDAAAKPPEGNGTVVTDKVVGRTTPGTDVADPDEAVVGSDDSDAASEAEVWLEDDRPTVADSSAGTTDTTSDAETAPQNFKQKLLDESTGDLVALEDFDREVDDRAFESEWLGAHNDISRQAIREELLRKGEYTAHVDDAGKLLKDPDEYRLAVEVNARITLCVHRERSDDQKREFILRSQTGQRVLSYEEQRELKNRLIVVRLRLGVDYESIAKTFRVSTTTVRNVETRAAADTNSKHGIAKRDRRVTWSTPENIAEANRLRTENKSSSEIAKLLGTTPATIGKVFKTSASEATTNVEDKPGEKRKAGRATSPMQPPQPIEDIAATDGVPKLHRRNLDDLRKGTQDYIEWLKGEFAKAQGEIEEVADSREAVLKLAIRGGQLIAVANLWLEKKIKAGGEIDVEEATPPGGSSPGKSGHQPAAILRGVVMADDGEELFVALPVGGGVIDNRDNCLAKYGPLDVGKVIRVRVEGFDWKRGLWRLQPQGRQTPAPAPGAIAGSHRDDRRSPDEKLAGSKAGPKENEVIER